MSTVEWVTVEREVGPDDWKGLDEAVEQGLVRQVRRLPSGAYSMQVPKSPAEASVVKPTEVEVVEARPRKGRR